MGHYEVLANLRIGFRWQLQLAELEQSFVSGTETIPAIRRKLEELWPNASKNRSWCVERAKTDARTAILCSKLAGCAGHLLEQERGRDVLIEWREDAVEGIARALQEGSLSQEWHDDLVHDLLGHLTYLGYLHMANGNMGRARATLERAHREGISHNTQFAEGVVQLHLAMIALREENLDQADAYLHQALASAQSSDQPSVVAASHNVLGVIANRRGLPEKAVAEYGEAARLYEELNQRPGMGTAYANRAGSLLDLGRLDEAEQDLKQAIGIAEALKSPEHTALCAVNQARLMSASPGKDQKKIIDLLEEARSSFAKIGDVPQLRRVDGMLEDVFRSTLAESGEKLNHDQRSHILCRLAEIASQCGDARGVTEWMEQLLAAAVASQDWADELEARGQLGHAALQLGGYETAVEHLNRALTMLDRSPATGDYAKAECEIRLDLGQACRHFGRHDDADNEFERAQAIALSRLDREAEWRARGNRALNNVDRGRQEVAISSLKDLVKELQQCSDYRLLGQTRFNLAYALYRRGDFTAALLEGKEAQRLLEIIGDQSADKVRRQMANWEKTSS